MSSSPEENQTFRTGGHSEFPHSSKPTMVGDSCVDENKRGEFEETQCVRKTHSKPKSAQAYWA